MADGQVVFEITADGKKAIASVQDVTRAIQAETRKWDSATDQATGDMGNSFASMLKKVGSAISAAAIAKKIVDIGKACVEAASDLAEVQNVVDVTFGASSREIDAWAKNAGEKYGLTETAAKRYASTIGAMMKSSGMAGSEITTMSKDLAGLAADMASFYNMDFDTAFDKIKAGISGQTMPLKSLGIDMSVASLNAYAMAEGMDKAYSEMSQGEQMLLRYKYLMKATADAQGDFARTSDGFANGMRKIETQLDSAKTKLGTVLLPFVENVLSGFNIIMDQIIGESSRTVLDDFADIDAQVSKSMSELNETISTARTLADVMEGIYTSGSEIPLSDALEKLGISADEAEGKITSVSQAVAEIISRNGVNTEASNTALSELGYSTEEIAEQNRLWLESCKRLTETIPGLTSVINTETGMVDGGIAAIEAYVTAYGDAQEKIIMMRAHAQRRQALDEKFSELPGLKIDYLTVQSEADKYYRRIKDRYRNMGIDTDEIFGEGMVGLLDWRQKNETGMGGSGVWQYIEEDVIYYQFLLEKLEKAESAWREQQDAYDKAVAQWENEGDVLESVYGDVDTAAEEATDAVAAFWLENEDGATSAVENAKDALSALADYAQSVHDAVAASVDSVITGFNKVKSPVGELETQRSKLIEEQMALDSSASDYQTKWEEIEKKIQEINGQIREYKPAGMMEGLQSQLAFMEQYTANLQAAQRLGLSSEFLASLSDGSVESAEYLAQLVADPEAAKKVDAMWQQVQAEKKKFTDTLTAQQLEGDSVYQSLAESARQAVAELDLYSAAAENSGKTVSGVAQGIADHLPEVEEAVNGILAEVSRLSGLDISINFGTFGDTYGNDTAPTVVKPGKKNKSGAVDGDFAVGLDFVPFDGFLASLHAGEGILTEQENRVWQRFKNGGSGVDYETMGGVVRDNIGGNVYLDGRVVGSVISEQQGKAFRQLKRSGWSG